MLQKIKTKLYTLLRTSEKYTKTDMVYLAKGGFWLLTGRFLASVSAFILSIVFANVLTPETYGTYKYILATGAIIGIVALPGINIALVRSISLGNDHAIREVIKTKSRWAVLGGIIGFCIALYYFIQGNNTLGISFLIPSIFVPIIEGFVIYGSILQGKKLFKKSATYSSLTQFSLALSLIITVLITKNITIIIFVYYFVTTLIGVLLTYTILKKHSLKSFNTATPDDSIAYGKQLSIINIIGTGASQIDKILLWHFIGAMPLAVYSFSLAPIAQIQGLLKTINILSLPKFTTQNPAIIKKTLNRKIIIFTALLLPPVIAYITLAPYIYSYIFPQYIDAVPYTQLYALSILLFPQGLISQALTAHKNTKSLYKLKIIDASTKIISLLILLPIFGIKGAIVALIIPQIMNAILLRYYLNKIDFS